jgi:hypothetical protein
MGFFDKSETRDKLTRLGNPLEKLHKVIDFEMFRDDLETSLLNHDRKTTASCKHYDVVMMFKIMLLKHFYNMSEEQAEYQINDRQSFKEFLGLSSGDRVPDARKIWLFQERLIKSGSGGELCNDNPHKKRQKDIEARWSEKGNQKRLQGSHKGRRQEQTDRHLPGDQCRGS